MRYSDQLNDKSDFSNYNYIVSLTIYKLIVYINYSNLGVLPVYFHIFHIFKTYACYERNLNNLNILKPNLIQTLRIMCSVI